MLSEQKVKRIDHEHCRDRGIPSDHWQEVFTAKPVKDHLMCFGADPKSVVIRSDGSEVSDSVLYPEEA